MVHAARGCCSDASAAAQNPYCIPQQQLRYPRQFRRITSTSARKQCSLDRTWPRPPSPSVRQAQILHPALAAAATAQAPTDSIGEAEQAKQVLRQRIAGTDRGASANSWQRALVAEAQADVERLRGGGLDGLPGLWRLVWTTADDVKPLIAAARLPLAPVQVGDIFQRFSAPEAGRVQNIIRLRTRGLSDQTFTVDAAYSVRSPSRIALTFEAASLSEVRISAALETVLAPALLPRTRLSQRILQELREFNVRVPLTTPSQVRRGSSRDGGQQRGFGEYVLSYIDGDMLIGSASQGTFIFERASE